MPPPSLTQPLPIERRHLEALLLQVELSGAAPTPAPQELHDAPQSPCRPRSLARDNEAASRRLPRRGLGAETMPGAALESRCEAQESGGRARGKSGLEGARPRGVGQIPAGGGAGAESRRGEEEPEWDKSIIQEAEPWRKPEPRKWIEGSGGAQEVGKGRSRAWEATWSQSHTQEANPGSSQDLGGELGEGPAPERRCLAERGGTSNLQAVWGWSPARGRRLGRASQRLRAWRGLKGGARQS